MGDAKRATEAFIGREDGRLLSSCDRCGDVIPYDRTITIFRKATGEKTDLCPPCGKKEGL